MRTTDGLRFPLANPVRPPPTFLEPGVVCSLRRRVGSGAILGTTVPLRLSRVVAADADATLLPAGSRPGAVRVGVNRTPVMTAEPIQLATVGNLALLRAAATDPDGALESHVYTFQDPLRFAGAWRTPERFDALTPADLQSRDGCTVFLHRRDERTFYGLTSGAGCESSINGAAYATSKATITPEGMITWDRGYSADGRQVWGATAGGYHFQKLQEPSRAD